MKRVVAPQGWRSNTTLRTLAWSRLAWPSSRRSRDEDANAPARAAGFEYRRRSIRSKLDYADSANIASKALCQECAGHATCPLPQALGIARLIVSIAIASIWEMPRAASSLLLPMLPFLAPADSRRKSTSAGGDDRCRVVQSKA
jgi:hypothetical protein